MFHRPRLRTKFIMGLALGLVLFYGGFSFAASGPAMITPHGQTMQLLPFLDYYIDESLTDDIEEIAILGQTNAFHPLNLDTLPAEEGVTWLRFVLAPRHPDLRNETYLLDMGQSIPGHPLLFAPVRNELSGAMEWRESGPAQRNILLLPESGSEALTCYLRLEGLPGPWFDPVIRSPHNAATNWGSLFHTGAIVALAMAMLLCLLRGMSENGQWRVWTALFVGLAMIQGILGMPAVSDAFSYKRVAASLAPGLALMTIPHVGRHMLKAGHYSRGLDIQLLILSLIGALLALAPLVPGFVWLDRWVDLWPGCAILFAPTAIGAWIMGLNGARPFLLACLIMPLFAAIAWFGLDFGLPANLLAAAPLCGVVLTALVLVTARMPAEAAKAVPARKKKSARKTVAQPLDIPAFGEEEEIINLDNPLGDTNLRIITAPPRDAAAGPVAPQKSEDWQPSPLKAKPGKETAIRLQLDNLLRESASLGQCALPPTSRMYAEKMIVCAENIGRIISDPDFRGEERQETEENEKFNLQKLLREAHDSVAPIAEHAGLSISWYMPPLLRQEYRGNQAQISETLRMLLDSSIRGTNRGQIKLSARHAPESPDPGHLLFSVSDTGNGSPPLKRSSVALARAWELAGKYNGFLAMESGPEGLSINFSLHLPIEEEQEQTVPARPVQVMLTGAEIAERQELAEMIRAIPLNVAETDSLAEAVAMQRHQAVNLLTVLSSQAKPASGDLIAEFVQLGKNAGFGAVHILAITPDESQWSFLKASGFTHAMLEPVDAETFKYTIQRLAGVPESAGSQAASSETPEKPQTGKAASGENIMDLMDNFYCATSRIIKQEPEGAPHEEAAQTEKTAPDSEEDEAARMLEEQDRDMGASFEGPDWLLNIRAGKQARQSEEAPESRGTETAKTPVEPETVAKGQFNNEFFEEWVGEPMPINSSVAKKENTPEPRKPEPQPAAANVAAPLENGVQTAAAPEMPAQPEKSSLVRDARATPAEDAGPETESVMDFIISVRPQRETAAKDADAPQKAPAEQTAPTKAASHAPQNADPVINAFLDKLDADLAAIKKAYVRGDCLSIEEDTAAMAQQAESFSCRRIRRLAACVERAAKARDLDAIGDFLPDLGAAVKSNRIDFTAGSGSDWQ